MWNGGAGQGIPGVGGHHGNCAGQAWQVSPGQPFDGATLAGDWYIPLGTGGVATVTINEDGEVEQIAATDITGFTVTVPIDGSTGGIDGENIAFDIPFGNTGASFDGSFNDQGGIDGTFNQEIPLLGEIGLGIPSGEVTMDQINPLTAATALIPGAGPAAAAAQLAGGL